MNNFIIIDLDNTLVDRVAAFQRWAKQFDVQHIDALIALDEDGFRPRPDFFQKASGVTGTPAATISENYLAQYPKAFDLDPAIADALTNLRDNNTVAIATNGPPFQEHVIRHTGLDELVDAWAVSELEGHRKPDARIVERMINELGQHEMKAIVIGDGIADIELAHNLGARSIWINRGRTWNANLHFKPSEITTATLDALHIAQTW